DYHGTLEAYAEAKSRLFSFKSLKIAVINIDDAHAEVMLNAAKTNPNQPKILTYSLSQAADYRVQDIQYSISGADFKLITA
ncbi:Mur ligase family protein, partial [Acinetobacter baumannii]